MPESIRSVHTIFTLIAIGILVGLGWALVHIAVAYPWTNRHVGGAAAVICLLLLLIAYLV